MKNIKCCMNCNDRYRIVDGAFIEDCHDHCERYQKEKQEHEKFKEENKYKHCRAIFSAKCKWLRSKFYKK